MTDEGDGAGAFPSRPRLGDHVHARRHVVDGRTRVFLHDARADRSVEVGLREWQILAAADGTRDPDGILLAAAREGARATREHLVAFFEQLHRAGLLDDGPATPVTGDESDATPADRLLDPLPGYRFRCDGSGQCCRTYATVLFSPLEALVARATLPRVLDGGERHDRVFTPERGSGPCGASAVTLLDGACAYLDADGLCAIHKAAGADAKPLGCTLYPVDFVDDGERVRVSVLPECACVLRSAATAEGDPLVAEGVRVRGDLPGAAVVRRLPSRVPVRGDETVAREAMVAWTRAALDTLPWGDPVSTLWQLADAVEEHGVTSLASPETSPPPLPLPVRRGGADPWLHLALTPPSPDRERGAGGGRSEEVRRWLRALHFRALRKTREHAWMRAEGDLVRRAVRWIASVTAALHDHDDQLTAALRDSARHAQRENLYVRAALHGYQLAEDPLTVALRDRAVRLLVARAMEPVIARETRGNSLFREPLTLVEAMMRAHGLGSYLDDL